MTKEKMVIRIAGMHCVSCAQTIKKALKRLDGVKYANVNLATEKATVEYSPAVLSIPESRKAVQEAGYEVISEEEVDRSVKEMEDAHKRMLVAWAFIYNIVAIPWLSSGYSIL